jgi:hypothetical protein
MAKIESAGALKGSVILAGLELESEGILRPTLRQAANRMFVCKAEQIAQLFK